MPRYESERPSEVVYARRSGRRQTIPSHNMAPLIVLGIGIAVIGGTILFALLVYIGWLSLQQVTWYFWLAMVPIFLIMAVASAYLFEGKKATISFSLGLILCVCAAFIFLKGCTSGILEMAREMSGPKPKDSPVRVSYTSTPYQSSTPWPSPTFAPVTPNPRYNIPWLHARVDSIRFFESGTNQAARGERQYRNKFTAEHTKFISWELNLEHETHAQDVDFEIEAKWYDPNGEEFLFMSHPVKKAAHAVKSDYTSGWGSTDAGWVWKSTARLPTPFASDWYFTPEQILKDNADRFKGLREDSFRSKRTAEPNDRAGRGSPKRETSDHSENRKTHAGQKASGGDANAEPNVAWDDLFSKDGGDKA